MEFFGLAALSSSQLLVVIAFALFATIIFSSIYIRIRGQYRGRNKLPNHTRRRVFGLGRKREADLPSLPKENREVVSGARRKAPAKHNDDGFRFDFDEPAKPSGPIEHVAVDANGEIDLADPWEVPEEVAVSAVAEANGNGVDENGYEASTEDEADFISPVEHEHFDETSENVGDVDADYAYSDEVTTESWDESFDDQYASNDSEDSMADADPFNDTESTYPEADEVQHGAFEVVNEVVDETVPPNSDEDYLPPTEYPVNDELAVAAYDDGVEEQLIEPEVDENVVPFDHRTVEAKRVGTTTIGEGHEISVVSICLISDDEGQVFRDIRGEHLAAFLNNRGFIFLDEEYHLQYKSMVEKGAIRVRNYEDTSIGTLVKQNLETRGFRLYFRPSDCVDPLATLNEMLKIANLAIGFFSAVSYRPLVIYDGRKDNSGNISRLTQGDYNQLKYDLSVAFPRNLGETSRRTVISRNEFAPSEDLPTRAEQF